MWIVRAQAVHLAASLLPHQGPLDAIGTHWAKFGFHWALFAALFWLHWVLLGPIGLYLDSIGLYLLSGFYFGPILFSLDALNLVGPSQARFHIIRSPSGLFEPYVVIFRQNHKFHQEVLTHINIYIYIYIHPFSFGPGRYEIWFRTHSKTVLLARP